MTVNTTTNRVSYAGNGTTTAFAVPFPFLADTDLVVLERTDSTGVEVTKTLTTHYTVTGAGGASGTVTMLTAPATGVTLVIYRDPALTQLVDLVPNDPLPVETAIEQPLDRLTMIAQRARDLVERSLRLPDGDTGFTAADMKIPAKVTRAGNYLAFDVDGKPIASAGSTPGTTVTSSYMATVLDDPDASAAMDTLLSADERAYWKDKAALLDPAAYVFLTGAAFSETVPAGETWFALNLWNATVNTVHTELRVADINRAIPLPAGTVVASNGNANAFAYLCKPALVVGGASYATPRTLYFNRVNRLRTLALNVLRVATVEGAAVGTIYEASFPTDFTNGFITGAATFDAAWVILRSGIDGPNLLSEISDNHAARLAENIMLPFVRTTHDRIGVRGANTAGTTVATESAVSSQAENAGAVTVTSAGAQIVSINLGTVRAGDIVSLTGLADLAKGATGGLTHLRISKSAGTASFFFGVDGADLQTQFTAPASDTHKFSISGNGRVTVGGTLTLELRGFSAGSDSTVAIGGGEMYARVLRSTVLAGWGAVTYHKLPADW